jgi:hypothetical protein
MRRRKQQKNTGTVARSRISRRIKTRPILGEERRVRIVYRGLGRAFVVHKNRDLEGNNFLAALGLVCIVTSSQHGVAVFL